MERFEIFTDKSLGMSHCGSVDVEGAGHVNLTEEEIRKLFSIMVQAYEEGEDLETLDLSDTDLEEIDPKLYKKIYSAYYDCAYDAEEEYWIKERYYDNGFVMDFMDWEAAEQACIENGYWDPDEIDEEEDSEDFQEWFLEVFLEEYDFVAFERSYRPLSIYLEEFDFDVPISIPPALIKRFLEQHTGKES